MLIKDAAADLLALDEKEQNEITSILKSTDATLLVAMTDHIVATDTENSETKKTIEKLTDGLAALRRSDYMNSLEKSLDNTVDKLQARQMQLVRVFWMEAIIISYSMIFCGLHDATFFRSHKKSRQPNSDNRN